MDAPSFLDLVRELRAMGATHVRAGDLECAFAAPQAGELAMSWGDLDVADPVESVKQYMLDHYGSAVRR